MERWVERLNPRKSQSGGMGTCTHEFSAGSIYCTARQFSHVMRRLSFLPPTLPNTIFTSLSNCCTDLAHPSSPSLRVFVQLRFTSSWIFLHAEFKCFGSCWCRWEILAVINFFRQFKPRTSRNYLFFLNSCWKKRNIHNRFASTLLNQTSFSRRTLPVHFITRKNTETSNALNGTVSRWRRKEGKSSVLVDFIVKAFRLKQ